MASMNAIESQRRMRMAAQEKAEADKILVVKAAEAESEAKYVRVRYCLLCIYMPAIDRPLSDCRYLSGKGVARQRKAIVDGLKESVVEFNDGVAGTVSALRNHEFLLKNDAFLLKSDAFLLKNVDFIIK